MTEATKGIAVTATFLLRRNVPLAGDIEFAVRQLEKMVGTVLTPVQLAESSPKAQVSFITTAPLGKVLLTAQHSAFVEKVSFFVDEKEAESRARLVETLDSLFSPFPFHSVYSVEDHKKHVDWLKQVNPQALISVKVSTPTDVDMVAVGSYYAGAHIVHLDGAYGGTGAAPEIAKKNIAMPVEYALPKVHRFLVEEGIRDEVTLIASGGLRSAWDVAKAIALGADGAVLGTAELVAIGCIRIAQCEKGLGCPFGITSTDPERSKLIDAGLGADQIANLYTSWRKQLAGILKILGMRSIQELRGRSDLLVYLEG